MAGLTPSPEFKHNQLIRAIEKAKKEADDRVESLEKQIKEIEKQINQIILRVGTIESSNGR